MLGLRYKLLDERQIPTRSDHTSSRITNDHCLSLLRELHKNLGCIIPFFSDGFDCRLVSLLGAASSIEDYESTRARKAFGEFIADLISGVYTGYFLEALEERTWGQLKKIFRLLS